MEIADFVVVGSSGGGGTIAWLLAKAGLDVVVIEAGPDIAKPVVEGKEEYNPVTHDEYKYRLQRPDPKRRPRGDYNTFRQSEVAAAAPFDAAWTASVLGGGSIIWGTWAFRALPIDFRLRTHFQQTGQLAELDGMGYSIPDWPIQYSEMEPFYNVAETLLAVSGDRPAVNRAITQSAWYKKFESEAYFKNAGNWEPSFEYPCPPYPRTPVGHFIFEGMEHALDGGHPAGLSPVQLPVAIVNPGTSEYRTREAIQKALDVWGGSRPGFWDRTAADLWSERVRSACNLCGFCGEYLCWGKHGPKSGSRVSTLEELHDLPNVEVYTDARAYEVIYDEASRRATGVRFLDVSDPDRPRPRAQRARNV
ncbi:MAG TPA: GMC family oxidoreductase, partial [Thermoanaerobaculia bacterium]